MTSASFSPLNQAFLFCWTVEKRPERLCNFQFVGGMHFRLAGGVAGNAFGT
jgi:hypothetical protein